MLFDFLQGFYPSTAEIVIFALLVAAFIGVLVWLNARTRRRARARQEAAAEERFGSLLRERSLTPSDKDVVDRLRGYLRDATRAYLLLQNHTVFNDCAERALADRAVSEGEISALRVRLGFAGAPAGAFPESSSEIPGDSGVMIVDNHNRTIPARVLEPSPSSFRVETDEEAPRLTIGMLVEVVYQNGNGIFRFETAVTNTAGRELDLAHAEHLERVQRRRYYRGEVRLPVYVRLADTNGQPEPTELIDISAGGASFFVPDERYQEGEVVEMTFHPESDAALHLPGRIVRESRRGAIAHVRFENLQPGTRDRIMGLVFRNERR